MPWCGVLPAKAMKGTIVTRARFDWRRPHHWLAFGFGAGLAPWAPGTMGTLVAIPLYLLLQGLSPGTYLLLLVGLFLIGLWACDKTARELGGGDPGAIVWDEILGYLVTMALAHRSPGPSRHRGARHPARRPDRRRHGLVPAAGGGVVAMTARDPMSDASSHEAALHPLIMKDFPVYFTLTGITLPGMRQWATPRKMKGFVVTLALNTEALVALMKGRVHAPPRRGGCFPSFPSV